MLLMCSVHTLIVVDALFHGHDEFILQGGGGDLVIPNVIGNPFFKIVLPFLTTNSPLGKPKNVGRRNFTFVPIAVSPTRPRGLFGFLGLSHTRSG